VRLEVRGHRAFLPGTGRGAALKTRVAWAFRLGKTAGFDLRLADLLGKLCLITTRKERPARLTGRFYFLGEKLLQFGAGLWMIAIQFKTLGGQYFWADDLVYFG